MVFLIRQASAVKETLTIAKQHGGHVWIGSDAMSAEEHRHLTQQGFKVTRFSYPLQNASAEIIEDALATVREHHPGAVIWLQYVTPQEEPHEMI